MKDIKFFQDMTSFPIIDLMGGYEVFLNRDVPRIEAYYEGKLDDIPSNSFYVLELLIQEYQSAINIFEINRDKFSTLPFWDLLETLEDSLIYLFMIKSSDKFFRSSRSQVNFSTNSVMEYIQSYGETLEEISRKFGYGNNYDLVLENLVIEEDYTINGGLNLKVRANNRESFFVDSVINSGLYGKSLYGKDLDKNLTFTEEGDLKVLGNEETLLQAIEIYLNLKKGNCLQAPSLGIDFFLTSGLSLTSFQFPLIFRQIEDVFFTDDTFTNISITNTKIEEDNAYMDLDIYDLLGKNTDSVQI
jgi:LysM repeat protein